MEDHHGKTLLDLSDQLKAMPSYKVIMEIRSMSRSIELFDGNFHQLREQLDFFADARQSVGFEQNRDNKEHFQSEVMRYLHNYVASALSLVDHTRVHYRKLYREGEFPEYQFQIAEVFANDPLANFVKELRQYFQHYSLPNIYFQTSYKKGAPDFVRTVRLRNDNLREFDWKPKARSYLESQGGDIDLLLLILAYQEKVTNFYQWFQSRQEEIHREDFQKVEEVQAVMRSLAIPDLLNGLLQHPEFSPESFEASISDFLDDDERLVLGLMEPGSKATFLLLILKKMAKITPAMEKRIISIYEG